ncbi:hypothetical protein BC835DRAFT_1419524 [Cytidiella melzeri]|nr:hypothetical protein BC835DRAFT_1419524 [Cytidiella melzeri]
MASNGPQGLSAPTSAEPEQRSADLRDRPNGGPQGLSAPASTEPEQRPANSHEPQYRAPVAIGAGAAVSLTPPHHYHPHQTPYAAALSNPPPTTPFTFAQRPYTATPLNPPVATPATFVQHPPGAGYHYATPSPSPMHGQFPPRDTLPPRALPPLPGATQGIKQLAAANLGAKAFGNVPLTTINPTKPHLWYLHATVETRLLVVLNCIKAAGFEPFGEFLMAFLSEKHTQYPAVIKTVSTFVRGDSKEGTRPVDVVRALYDHAHVSKFGLANSAPLFPSLPRYALPPSSRLLASTEATQPRLTTQNALLDWALCRVLTEVDREADLLVNPSHGMTSRSQDMTWSMLCLYSLTVKQEMIAQTAPALFAVLATAATSKTARQKLESQVAARITSPLEGEPEPVVELPDAAPRPALFDEIPADKNTDSTRDVWLGVTVAVLMMLAFRYRFANMFQKFLGVFLFSTNVHRDVFRVLCRIGLCISYNTTLELLQQLGDGQSETLKEWGQSVKDGIPLFQIIFDNINKAHHAWQKTLATYDEIQSGTAGAVIKLEDVPPGAFDRQAMEAHMKNNPRADLTFEELEEDINWDHIAGVGAATILRIWVHWIPVLATHSRAVEKLFSETHQRHRLRLRKTEIVTLRCSNINESTTKGVDSVLMDIVLKQLCIIPEWLATIFLFICGDQLTIDRIRKLIVYMRKAGSPFNCRIWARPTIQLWHMKWAWQKAIVRLHWYGELEKGTYGLHQDCHTLGRNKYNPVKCDFYPTHHLLQDSFEAMILEALRLICEEDSSETCDVKVPLLTCLANYFGNNGPFANCSFEHLMEFSAKVYKRYLTLAAYDDAFGYRPRNTTLYGPIIAPLMSNSNNSSSDQEIGSASVAQRTKKGKQHVSASGFASGSSFKGDQAMINTTNFMRTVFWYTEFYAGVAEGDIGRVFEILKLLRFSFWGAGSTNYGNEMLELACHFIKDYPPETRIALLNNYLVNPSGLPGCWHEGDLLMEHLNHWLKNLLVKKTLDFDSPFMKNTIALNLSGFQALREALPAIFGLKKSSGYHPDADRSKDLNALGARYRSDSLLCFCPGRQQAYEVPNEFDPQQVSM